MSEKKPAKDKKPTSKSTAKTAKADAKLDKLTEQLNEAVSDLQRTRADFENYRKRVEAEKAQAREYGATKAITQIIPVIDTVERAIAHAPNDIKDNSWVKGVLSLDKQLQKVLHELQLEKIESSPGTIFDPEIHEAVQFDEDSEGDQEVIAEELQAGYCCNGTTLRQAIVRVTRQ